MLDLYTHEIPCPTDRAMHKFLWYSALHDGDLLSIQYEEGNRSDVTLRIRHSIFNDVRRGVYRLRFQGVKHVEYAASPFGADRVYSTRFLDSAALHQEQVACGKQLYHLRIVTWCGYIDLIFERFSIRLEGGRMDYRPQGIDDALIAANRDRRYREAYAGLARDAALHHDLDEHDHDEYQAFGLYIASQDESPDAVAARAREVLDTPLVRFGAHTYAAHLLGRFGTADDLPRLTRLLLMLPAWESHARRVVLDAMARMNEHCREEHP